MPKSSSRAESSSKSSSARTATKEPPPYEAVAKFARGRSFTVTSTTGGKHNTGSAHYQKRAVDVSVKGKSDQEINKFKKAAEAQGYKVRDERTRPPGQKVWSAPHIHLEVPKKTKKK